MDDSLFRVLVGVLSLLLYVSHLRHRSGNSQSQAARGFVEVGLALAACCWAISLILYQLGFDRFDAHALLPVWVRWLGVCGMVACLPLSIWIYRTLGVHFSTKLELQENHRLVTCGPYRFVRHPMYSVFFLCVISASLVSANLFVLATGSVTAALMVLRIKKEEHMLLSYFGEAYRRYAERTGAIIPRLRKS